MSRQHDLFDMCSKHCLVLVLWQSHTPVENVRNSMTRLKRLLSSYEEYHPLVVALTPAVLSVYISKGTTFQITRYCSYCGKSAVPFELFFTPTVVELYT